MDGGPLIGQIARTIEFVGIGTLLAGGLLASGSFAFDWRTAGLADAYHRFRANLGRAILLGLEILIVADIIRTVALEPTFENLGVLALIVLIRTFLSFALEIEISGRLPWHRGSEEGPHEPPPAGG